MKMRFTIKTRNTNGEVLDFCTYEKDAVEKCIDKEKMLWEVAVTFKGKKITGKARIDDNTFLVAEVI